MARSPRACLGRNDLPWAAIKVRQGQAVLPEGVDLGRASACAKGAAAGISRGAGTSATARPRSVCARSAAGRRRGGRPSGERTRRPKPSMSRRSGHAAIGCAAHGPRRRPKRPHVQRLRRRVVTQQRRPEIFFDGGLRPAGLPRTTTELPAQPGSLLRPRLSRGGSPGAGSRTQVALSQHVGGPHQADLRIRRGEPAAARMRREQRDGRGGGSVAGSTGMTRNHARAGRRLSPGGVALRNVGGRFIPPPVPVRRRR